MTKTDNSGRAYATVASTKAGDKIQVDADFVCIAAGSILEVEVGAASGDLFVECADGRHYLSDQESDGVYVGFYPVESLPKKAEFDHGDRAWTRDGVKVYVESETTAGQYVVSPFLNLGCFDPEEGPSEENTGGMVIVDELFAEPPRQFVDEKMAKVQAEIEKARADLHDIRSEAATAMYERTRLLDKLKQVPALAYIEQFLDGKMGWVVISDYYVGFKVMTMAEAIKSEDGWRKETKLLTLFGDSKGDLHWRINQYRDGSGNNSLELWAFDTEEQAAAFKIEKLKEAVDGALVMFREKPEHYASSLVSAGKHYEASGGALPEELVAWMTAARRQHLLKERERAAGYAKQYNETIAKADAELAALGDEPKPAPLAPMPGPDDTEMPF